MDKYLVEKFGAGSLEVGSIVELTESQAAFYASKVRKIEEEKALEVDPADEEKALEVATPKRGRKPKS